MYRIAKNISLYSANYFIKHFATIIPDLGGPTTFQRFFLSFYAQKIKIKNRKCVFYIDLKNPQNNKDELFGTFFFMIKENEILSKF